MAFTKKIPEWNASGVEPPQSLKDSGWKPGVKPAADHFNWLQTTASEAIKELQQKAGEVKKVNGQLPDANGNVNVNIDTSKLATKEELSSASTYIQQEMNDLEQTVAAHQTDYATFKTSTEKTLNDLVSTKDLSMTRSNKDSYGTFTTLTYRRKSDNTLYGTDVVSGGTAPYYTTRTIKFYDVDGTTLLKTIVKTVTYDADGDWIGDV